MTVSTLEETFKALEAAAIAGGRCPMNEPDGPLHYGDVPKLARAGRILIEISGRNFRQVTILVGEHAGKKTAPNPDPNAPIWQTLGKNGRVRHDRRIDGGSVVLRERPSAPRPLTAAELGS